MERWCFYGLWAGENNEDIGNAAFQADEYGNHLTKSDGGLVPIGANAFKLCNFKNGYLSYSGYGEVLQPTKGILQELKPNTQ